MAEARSLKQTNDLICARVKVGACVVPPVIPIETAQWVAIRVVLVWIRLVWIQLVWVGLIGVGLVRKRPIGIDGGRASSAWEQDVGSRVGVNAGGKRGLPKGLVGVWVDVAIGWSWTERGLRLRLSPIEEIAEDRVLGRGRVGRGSVGWIGRGRGAWSKRGRVRVEGRRCLISDVGLTRTCGREHSSGGRNTLPWIGIGIGW